MVPVGRSLSRGRGPKVEAHPPSKMGTESQSLQSSMRNAAINCRCTTWGIPVIYRERPSIIHACEASAHHLLLKRSFGESMHLLRQAGQLWCLLVEEHVSDRTNCKSLTPECVLFPRWMTNPDLMSSATPLFCVRLFFTATFAFIHQRIHQR